MIRLHIEDDEGLSTTVTVSEPQTSIGRHEENHIRLVERNVSRRHARLVEESNSVFIEDLDSYNGVRVNGERIAQRTQISDRDLVEIGDYRLTLVADGTPSEPETLEGTSDDTPPVFQLVDGSAKPPPSADDGASPPPPIPAATPPPTTPPPTTPPPGEPAATTPAPVSVPATPAGGAETPTPTPAERPQVSATDITTADTAVVRIGALPSERPRPEPQAAPQSTETPTSPGRLVCLVPPFEGQEHLLDRPELMIGRSPTCDIPLDHRSIDDQHVKVVYQHGTYSVVDLGSAEGFKVNDEPYRMISLRRADVLTIGSLRFRFVAADEEFTFVPGIDEAERFVETAAARRKGLPVIVGLAAGALALVAIAVVMMGGEDTGEASPDGAAAAPEAAPESPSPGNAGAPPPPSPPPVDPAVIAEAMNRGKSAVQGEDWDAAMASFKTVLEQDSANQEARLLLDRAAAEHKSAKSYEQCTRLFAAQDYSAAFEACKAIPETSRYAERAAQLLPKIREGFVRQHLSAAQQYAQEGNWERAKVETEQVFIFDPDNATARKLQARISAGLKRAPAGRPPRTSARKPGKEKLAFAKSTKATAAKPRSGRKSRAAAREQAKKLYVEATKFHQANKLERAIEMYKKAVRADGTFAYAYRGLGIAYASLGNGRMACKMYRKYIQIAPSAADRSQVEKILEGCGN